MARMFDLLAAGAIILLGLALRWDRLQYTEFSADQGWVINRAYDFVTRGDFPLAGILTSIGSAQGPVEVWLLAIPVAISRDPVVATGFVGLLQVLAAVGTYFFARRYFGLAAGLVASFLFVVNPWAIHHAHKIWTPNMLPPFTVLFFVSLFAAVVERRRRHLALACAWLTVLFLIHPQSAYFAPLLLLVVLVFWRRLGLRPLLAGTVMSLVVALPYLIYESGRGFASLRVYLGFASGTRSHMDLEPLGLTVAMASGLGFPSVLEYSFRGEWSLPDLAIQNIVATGLLFLGMGVCLRELWLAWSRRRAGAAGWEKYALLLLWFWVPVLVSLRHYIDMWPHYFLAVYPVQFVFLGLAVAHGGTALGAFADRWRPRWSRVALATVGALVLWLGASQAFLYRSFIDNTEHLGPQRPYGVPLNQGQQAAATLRQLQAELGKRPTYLYAYNYRIPLDYLARPDLRLQHVDPPMTVVLPRDLGQGVLVALASDDSGIAAKQFNFRAVADDGPLVPLLRSLGFADLPERTLQGPDGYVYFRFWQLPPSLGRELLGSFRKPEHRLVLANGMSLVGCRYTGQVQAGGKVRLELLWDLPPSPEKYKWTEYNLALHLLDVKGQVVAQHDWELWQYLGWRSDEYMVTNHELDVPEGAGPLVGWLAVGAYERYGRQPVQWVDGGGKETGSAYKVGPVIVRSSAKAPAQEQAGYRYGAQLELEGYDLRVMRREVEVGLHWRGLQAMADEYVVSVQLLDSAGRLVAQADSPPVGGLFPTIYWGQGEKVFERRRVEVPVGAGAGDYELAVILYNATTGQRLAVAGPDGSNVGDHARLTSLKLGEER